MKKITFEEYLKSKVKTASKGYLKSIEKFNEGFKNDKYLHHDSNPDEVKTILDLREGWDYKDKEISNFKDYLVKKFPFLSGIDNLEDLSIKNLKKLSSGMQSKISDPLLRAISQSYSSGNLSAAIGLLIEYKKLIIEVSQEDGESLDFKRNRIIYGAPGTGKSYKLMKESERFKRTFQVRKINENNLEDAGSKFWLATCGEDNHRFDDFKKRGIFAIGWDEIKDLRGLTRDAINEILISYYKKSQDNKTINYFDYMKNIKKGDVIIIRKGIQKDIAGIGVITEEYKYDEFISEYPHTVKVDWKEISKNIHLDEYSQNQFTRNTIAPCSDEIVSLLKDKSYFFDVSFEERTISTVERVTFYDGYTHGQFTGSYKPFPEEEGITYKYVPGPFFRQLVKAYKYPEHNFCLIIEELNRARADRVFGNIFQLLDRDESGNSRYKIALTEEQKNYLKDVLGDEDIEILDDLKEDGMYIPHNLYIWATMNSADQGVYHLDTAFKRRWSFEHIGLDQNMNEFENDEKDYTIFYQRNNENLWDSVSWNDFREVINDALMKVGIHEDRLIAPFFVGKSDFGRFKNIEYGEAETLNNLGDEVYVNKLLMYLFDDVLRYKKNDNPIFEDYKSFSKLKKGYENDNSIFNNTILERLNKKSLEKNLNQTFDLKED